MTKTTVRKHARKGTRGVRSHTRSTSTKKKVPHTIKQPKKRRVTLNRLIKHLNLELRHLSYIDTKTGDYKELDDFNDLPEDLRKKKWDFNVDIDRIPVEDSTEFGYIEIRGNRVTGKKKAGVGTSIDLSTMKLQPTEYKMIDTYQEIDLDTRMEHPIEEIDTKSRKKIERTVKQTINTNFPNSKNKIKFHWEN